MIVCAKGPELRQAVLSFGCSSWVRSEAASLQSTTVNHWNKLHIYEQILIFGSNDQVEDLKILRSKIKQES